MIIYLMSNVGYFIFACETLIMSLISIHPDFECRLTNIGAQNVYNNIKII